MHADEDGIYLCGMITYRGKHYTNGSRVEFRALAVDEMYVLRLDILGDLTDIPVRVLRWSAGSPSLVYVRVLDSEGRTRAG